MNLKKKQFYELFAERFFEELARHLYVLKSFICKSAVEGEAGHFGAWLCDARYRTLIQKLIITVINIQQLVTINRQSTFQ